MSDWNKTIQSDAFKNLSALQPTEIPEPPWPVGSANAQREGWRLYFKGQAREKCPFPPARPDLLKGYQAGWDAAHEHRIANGLPDPLTAAVTADDIREIPVPPSTGINAWIRGQVVDNRRWSPNMNHQWVITEEMAAEIARGACLAIIADRETLVANLRRAGYTVIEPLKGVQEI